MTFGKWLKIKLRQNKVQQKELDGIWHLEQQKI